MADLIHPAASKHAPMFITAPGETDGLLIACSLILVLAVLGFGVFFFRLHSLPLHIAHKGQRLQFEIVGVLALISLFTHEHIFWIMGLLLAFVDLPDYGAPLNRIAGSAEKIAGIGPGEGAAVLTDESKQTYHARQVPIETSGESRREQDGPPVPMRQELVSAARES